MSWELVIETATKEHVLPLGTDDEEKAQRALEEAKEKMAQSKLVTIAGQLVVSSVKIESALLRKGFSV